MSLLDHMSVCTSIILILGAAAQLSACCHETLREPLEVTGEALQSMQGNGTNARREVGCHALFAASSLQQPAIQLEVPLMIDPCMYILACMLDTVWALSEYAESLSFRATTLISKFWEFSSGKIEVSWSTFLLEGLIKGHSMTIWLGVHQNSITVEEQSLGPTCDRMPGHKIYASERAKRSVHTFMPFQRIVLLKEAIKCVDISQKRSRCS